MAKSASLPPNPELEHHPQQVAATAAAQGTNGIPGAVPDDTGGVGGIVYVTQGVPDLRVRVLPGQNVKLPDDDEVGEPGNYFGAGCEDPETGEVRDVGDEFSTHGPTAHMLEVRGYVEIIGEAS